jgi:corrinoid protein of di/trimethylamine methyltransferase
MTKEILTKLSDALVEGDPDLTCELVAKALIEKIEPMTIIEEALVPGMAVVGERFSSGEYFLPNLIISANGMQRSMELLEPVLRTQNQEVKSLGKVVIGTVQGDIHEIGKSLVGTMLSVNGFQVYDLGVDVSIERFLSKIRETGANVLGMSALLTTTMTVQREMIKELEKAGLRKQVKVIVGGAPVTSSWAAEIGADGYAEDAIRAVEIAKSLAGKGD